MRHLIVPAALLPAIALASLTACEQRPRTGDLAAVSARYAFRFEGECSSWLKSYETGFEYCASPKVELPMDTTPAPVEEKKEDGPVTKEAMMARGEEVYGQICVACHQANGQGVPGAFPPLAGAGEYYDTDSPDKMIGIILNGLNGEIQVLGTTYNGVMPAQGPQLSDYEVASVANYVRNSWGNSDENLVKPEQVKALR